MIVIVDSGLGNVGSIKNMIKKIGFTAEVSAHPETIMLAKKLILPGVGAFDYGMRALHELKLVDVLRKKVLVMKTPILGICLGLQMMAKSSAEGVLPGLNWLDAEVIKFSFNSPKLRLPHIGWNLVKPIKHKHFFSSMHNEIRFYFVHSYHVICHNQNDIMATTNYGGDFVAALQKENIYGVQFHPEKSHHYGMHFLKTFIEEV